MAVVDGELRTFQEINQHPGDYEVEFLNGEKQIVNVKNCIVDTQARPINLITPLGTMYNFQVIISVRKIV